MFYILSFLLMFLLLVIFTLTREEKPTSQNIRNTKHDNDLLASKKVDEDIRNYV